MAKSAKRDAEFIRAAERFQTKCEEILCEPWYRRVAQVFLRPFI